MSDSADDIEQYSGLFENWLENQQDIIENNTKKGYWQTKEGVKIPLNNLTKQHKDNIIRYCYNTGLISPF